ncbi:metallophosphoesterase family protein [Desulfolithobacter sp.]
MIKAGILSDTHLFAPDGTFASQTARAFGDCEIIIHAGDLTEASVLDIFGDKKVYAVHGNMCSRITRERLPSQQNFEVGDFSFGLIHGAGLGYDIESALWDIFPEADCVIYGHTHQASCRRQGDKLFINPGSFRSTGRYGAPGTYALLSIGETLKVTIHEVSSP